MASSWQSTTTTKLRVRANKHGLGALELAFPCVTCSFVVIVLLLCFCCCPLLLYRLRGEIGYNYLALLYFMLGLVVFGVVGESLLIARRRGRLSCRRDVEKARPSFSSAASDDRGALRDQSVVKAPLCHVHRPRPTGPPPAYDFITSSKPPRTVQPVATQVKSANTITLDSKTPTKSVDVKAINKNADVKKMTTNWNNKTTNNMDVKTTMSLVKTENVGSKTTDNNVDIIATSKNADVKSVTNDVNINVNMNTDIQISNTLDSITTTKNEEMQASTEDGDINMTDEKSDGDPTSKDADVSLKDDTT
ncbi:hypothetical protein PR048_007425 [Dryococelus australis]|uniref:Uncharacterized protein n=1 Tax=Dryococelus australis TaxID=614101 RepID=A0ABQ9HU74_9NEOP|nr:hypothetical protein PR048_007425 [Dryococelus australis]